MVVRARRGLGSGGVFSYGRQGGRCQAGQGGGRVVGGILAPFLALAGGEADLTAVADLLELSVDAIGLVEFDADLSGGPLAVGAGEDVGGEGR